MEDRRYDRDWSDANESVVRQMLAQGEQMLVSQIQLAVNADQRAMTSASIFIGVAAALFAATLAYFATVGNVVLFVSGLSVSALMLCAAYLCFHAARPVDFWLPGNCPAEWWGVDEPDLVALMGAESENYQEKIEDNNGLLASNARWFSCGIQTAFVAPVVGVGIWVISSLL